MWEWENRNKNTQSWAWWCISVIPALRGLGQDSEFEISLGYTMKPVSKKKFMHTHIFYYCLLYVCEDSAGTST
jgi:hypothetical protein